MLRHIDKTLKWDLRQSASFEPSCACSLHRSFQPVIDCWKEVSKEKSHTIVTYQVCMGAPSSNRLQWKLTYLFRSSMQTIFHFPNNDMNPSTSEIASVDVSIRNAQEPLQR
jgi:hypothetical protein